LPLSIMGIRQPVVAVLMVAVVVMAAVPAVVTAAVDPQSPCWPVSGASPRLSWLARAHGGELAYLPGQPGGAFQLRLPLRPAEVPGRVT
jgi:hypothetical protein